MSTDAPAQPEIGDPTQLCATFARALVAVRPAYEMLSCLEDGGTIELDSVFRLAEAYAASVSKTEAPPSDQGLLLSGGARRFQTKNQETKTT